MSSSAGSLSGSAIGSCWSRVKSSSSFFAMPTATRLPRPSSLERVVGGRELSLAAVDQDQVGKRSALLRAPCDSAAARPRASRRNRPGSGNWGRRSFVGDTVLDR